MTAMQSHSLGSRREKLYTVHPSRLIHAQGGLYLIAFVPAYAEVRTFAVERIRTVSVQETTFEPLAELDTDPFKNSLGVHRGGSTCKVRLRFHPQIAPLVKERTWHASQTFNDRADGSVVMTLDVTDDYALRNWILGFGRFVKVLAPAQLVKGMEDELEAAWQQYGWVAWLSTAMFSRRCHFRCRVLRTPDGCRHIVRQARTHHSPTTKTRRMTSSVRRSHYSRLQTGTDDGPAKEVPWPTSRSRALRVEKRSR